MMKSTLKILVVVTALGLFGLCSLATMYSNDWIVILADDFNDCRITSQYIQGMVGYFVIEDPNEHVELVVNGPEGYILFEDEEGGCSEPTRFYGIPVECFVKDHFQIYFDLTAFQETTTFNAKLTDEDDLDVLNLSMGNNDHWLLDGVDTDVHYVAGVAYSVMVEIAVDPLGGPASYAISLKETTAPFYSILSEGFLPGFTTGKMIAKVLFEKPAFSAAGQFALDNIYMHFVEFYSSNGYSQFQKY